MLWPPGSDLQNEVNHAAALLLFNSHSVNFSQPLSWLGSKMSRMIGMSVEQLLYPLSITQVLTQEACFIMEERPATTGRHSPHVPHVRLDVPCMRAAVHSAALAQVVPPLVWQEDRSPSNPTDDILQPNHHPAAAGHTYAAAEPWVLGAGAGASTGSLATAPPQAPERTPFRYFTHMQQQEAQHTTAMHAMQLQQHGNGSYAASLARQRTTIIKQEAITSPESTRLPGNPTSRHHSAAAVHANLGAEPYVLGIRAGAGAGGIAPPRLQATPHSGLAQQRHQHELQQRTATFELQLPQQGDGSYAASLAQHSTTNVRREASTSPAGARLSALPQPHHDTASSGRPKPGAKSCVQSAGTDAGSCSLTSATLQALPCSDLSQHQDQDQSQHTTATQDMQLQQPLQQTTGAHGMQLQQHSGESYAASLTNTTYIKQEEASTSPAGARLPVTPKPHWWHQDPAAAAGNPNSAVAPCVLGAGAGSLAPAPLQAVPLSDAMQQQQQRDRDRDQAQHITAAHGLQQGDGSYAQHSNRHSNQQASTHQAGAQTDMHPQGVQGSSSGPNDIHSLLELLPMDAG